MTHIIQKEYIFGQYSMVSASDEARKCIYRKVDDKRGNVWLIPINDPDPSSRIHIDNPRDCNSDGYGGRILTFSLENGEEYKAKGPWNTGADSLFAATGIDLRDTVLTQVIIGLDRIFQPKGIKDVIYLEDKPQAGRFSRGESIASNFADRLGRPVLKYSKSSGGSSTGFVAPTCWDDKQEREWFKTRELAND